MSKHTPSEPKRQLSLFNDTQEDNRPLPLIIAERWNFPLQYHEVENEYWYSVLDWIAGLTQDTISAASRTMSNFYRSESVFSKHSLKYQASDGKIYQRDFTNDKGLYDIAQYLRASKGREALIEIRDFLSKSGVYTDTVRRDPSVAIDTGVEGYRKHGKDDKWIALRIDGKIANKQFREALCTAVAEVLTEHHYATAQNDVYFGLYKRTAAQLRGELSLKKHDSLRDNQPGIALAYQRIAEEIIAHELQGCTEIEWTRAETIIMMVAEMIGGQVNQASIQMGIDVATGKRLLKSGGQ